MGTLSTAISLVILISAGSTFAQPANPFKKVNKELFFEGWYEVDKAEKLTGLLVIDVINGGVTDMGRIDYSGVPDFEKCSAKPANWSCKYNPENGMLSFVPAPGTFELHDDASFRILFKFPHIKKLTDKGYIYYLDANEMKGMTGLTRIEAIR